MKSWKMIFVVFVLVLSQVLAACGAPAATPAATEPPAAAATEPPAEPTAVPPTAVPEPVDLELWAQATVTEAGAPPDDWIAYDVIREELNINLTYVIIPTGEDGEAFVNTAAAANELPDLFQVVKANNDSRGGLLDLVELGLVAPVEDLMPLMPERVKTHYNDPLLINLVTFDGHQYGLPEPPPLPRREGLVIRKDWLDKLNLEVPTTPEELLAVAKAFTEQDPDGNGKKDTYGIGGFINQEGLGNRFDFITGAWGLPGVWNFAEPDNFGLNVRSEKYPEALAYFKSLVDAKVIDPDWPTLKRDDFRARWKQGLFGIMWEDFAALTNKSNYEPFDTNFPEAEWIPIESLTGPQGDSYYGVYTGRGNIFAVSQSAMDEGKGEAIARLLEWMATDGYYLMGFGEEGKNFIIDENGDISTEGLEPTEAYTAPERQPYTQMRNQLIFFNSEQEIRARYPSYETLNGRTMQPMEFLQFFQEQPWTDGRGVQVILPLDNAADFTRFYNEGMIQFVLGQKPLNEDSWAEYLAGLDALGAAEWEASAKQALMDAGLLE
jgi:putative aldouronate transport system substrate-binding protein